MSGIQAILYGQPFVANTAVFDGSSYAGVSAVVTGLAASKVITASYWLKMNADSTTQQHFVISSGGAARFSVFRLNSTNKMTVSGRDSSGTTILSVVNTTSLTGTAWTHIFFCFDLTDTAKRKIYINGASDLGTVTTYTNANMDLAPSSPLWRVGDSSATGSPFKGTMCELWMDDIYLDNPTAFYSGGRPVGLGPTGAIPTGSPPAVYYSLVGSGTSWASDSSGNGNNLSITGSLTAGTPP